MNFARPSLSSTLLLLPFLLLLFQACDEAPTVIVDRDTFQVPDNAVTVNVSEYELGDLPGSELTSARRLNADGKVVETGYLHKNMKTGTWVTYDATGEMPVKIITYDAQGRQDGPYLDIDSRGRVGLMANYRQNKLHGKWGKYKLERPETIAHYNNGELDGQYLEYDYRNGNLKKEVNFKNGKQDGIMRYYNEDGSIQMEYNYRNGELIKE
ncbi:MAG: hypothetical protein WBA17_12905 [Saprospiraceae bacterium]